MLKRATLLPIWFGITFVLLSTALFLQYHVSQTRSMHSLAMHYERNKDVALAGSLTNVPKLAGEVLSAVIMHDARPVILENFLKRYRSPLANHALYMIEVADKYDLDYRLLPAIAMQESGGGKIIPPGSYNAWGYAITETQSLGFIGWEQAIDRVARGVKTDYIDQGLVLPEQIMMKYTPASLERGGAWAKGVHYFMEEME